MLGHSFITISSFAKNDIVFQDSIGFINFYIKEILTNSDTVDNLWAQRESARHIISLYDIKFLQETMGRCVTEAINLGKYSYGHFIFETFRNVGVVLNIKQEITSGMLKELGEVDELKAEYWHNLGY